MINYLETKYHTFFVRAIRSHEDLGGYPRPVMTSEMQRFAEGYEDQMNILDYLSTTGQLGAYLADHTPGGILDGLEDSQFGASEDELEDIAMYLAGENCAMMDMERFVRYEETC